MAELIKAVRDATARLAGRRLGVSADQQRDTAAQKRAALRESDIVALPTDSSEWNSLQVLDDGPDIGKFWYMVGYDPVGGDHPIGP